MPGHTDVDVMTRRMVDLLDTFAVILKNATSLYLTSAAQVFKDGFYRSGAYDIAVLEQTSDFRADCFPSEILSSDLRTVFFVDPFVLW